MNSAPTHTNFPNDCDNLTLLLLLNEKYKDINALKDNKI